MIKYLTGLKLRLAEDNKHFILEQNFEVIDKRGIKWVAPAGLKTDGASVPTWLRPVIGDPFKGKTLEAAITHDAACQYQTNSQKNSHRIFRELCEDNGVSRLRAWIMWSAVRVYCRIKYPKWK